MFNSVRLIGNERERQLMLGHKPENDAQLPEGVLARAAVAILLNDAEYWYWGVDDFNKCMDRRSKRNDNLIVAAALIAAEIDKQPVVTQQPIAYLDNEPVLGENNHEI